MSTALSASERTVADRPRPNALLGFLTLSGSARPSVRDLGLFVLRLAMVLLFFHGLHKAQGYSGFIDSLRANSVGKIAPELFGFLVVAGQLLLGFFLLLGLFTRWCGLLLAILFGFIIGAVNIPAAGWMNAKTGGVSFESALFYFVPGLVLFFTGPGRWSLDHMLTKREDF